VKTDLAVAESLADIPVTSKGNPKVDLFPYRNSHPGITEFTYEIPLSGLESTFYVAAHADVLKTGATKTEGAWADGTAFVPGKRSWGMYFTYDVQPCNQPPVAVNDAATVAEDSSATMIDVLANDSDPDNDPFTIISASDPANGTVEVAIDGLSLTYQPDANYCNDASSTDDFIYTLDPGGATAIVSVTVTCVDDMPAAVDDTASVAEDSGAATIDVLANDTDVEGNPFSIASVTQPANGIVAITSGGADLTYQPNANYCSSGSTTDNFTYTLTPGGATATVAVTVTCVDDAPVAVNDAATVLEDSGANAIDVLANDTDVDGGPKIVNSVTQPVNGTVVITNGGAGLSYQPNANYCNNGSPTDYFTYTLSLGGSTATVSVTVTCVDDAPVAVNDTATVLEDSGATTINVLANDTDTDGGSISIDSVTQPVNGVVAITNGGADLSYQPNANACNNGSPTDDFTYTLTPGGSTATVAVTVTCVNDAPDFTLPASPNQSVVQDSGPQSVAGFATNINAGPANETGQTLTFSVSNNNNSLFSSQPDIDESTGDLTYTPAGGAIGQATVSVSLTDDGGTDNGGLATSEIKIFLVIIFKANTPPAANAQSVTTNEDTLKTITLSGTDADGDSLTFSIASGPSHGSLGSLGVVSCAANTCTVDVDYTPASNFNGADSFTFTVNDGQADSSTATVDITVDAVNDAPSFTKGADQTVLEDSGAQAVNGWASTISSGPADEAGQTVTFNITGNTNLGLFSAGPAVASNGDLTYTPAANAFGSAIITLALQDSGGTASGGDDTSDTQNFVINVTGVNDVPSFTKGADQTVNEDAGAQSVSNWATGVSAGPNESAQTVTFVIDTNDNLDLFSAGPAVASNGTLTYTPAVNKNGEANITLHIQDNGGTANGGVDSSGTQAFKITVNAVNDAPSALAKNFNAQANMKITGLTGLLTGATDPDSGDSGYTATFTVGTVSATTPAGGTISNLNTTTGTFDFDPPPGASGNVTFTYTVCDSGIPLPPACSAPATVTVNVAGPVIWFVNPTAGVNGDGRLSGPFNNLASAAAVDASGQRIFVYSGTATSGITLNTSEWLIGQGVTGTSFDAVFSIIPPTGTIARPSINGTRPTIQGNVVMATSAAVRGLNIQPASGTAGLTASGASSLTVGEVSVTTTNATAVGLTNSDGTFSFTRIDASGGPNGIVWNNASLATGSFTVNGDGANTAVGGNGSGGTIANMSGSDGAIAGTGIYLNNARDVTLRRMTINGTNQNYGIKGLLVNGFTLEYSTVSGTNGTSPSLPAPENYGEGAIYFGNATTNGVAGSATFTKNNISGGRGRNLSIVNTAAGTTTLTVKGNTFGAIQNFTNSGTSFAVEARLNSGVIINTTFGGINPGEGNTLTSAVGDLVNFTGQQLTTMGVVMQNNTLSNNNPNNTIGGGSLTLATAGTMTFNVSGNTMRDANGSAVTLFKAGALSGVPSMSGIFTNNSIGVNGVAGSGSKTGNGIFVSAGGTGTMSYTITNNTILQYLGNAAIYADNTGGSYAANFTITGNTAAQPGAGVFAGLAITNGSPGSGDTINVCADIKNNNFSEGDPANANDIIVGASGALAGHTFNLPGYAGGANLTNVQNFIQNNNLFAGTVVTAYVDAPATAAAFTGTGTSCNTP
jgi:VCBS repeat-containing protein